MIHSTAIQWWMLLAVLPALFLTYVGFSLVLRFRWFLVICLVVTMFCGLVLLRAVRHRAMMPHHYAAHTAQRLPPIDIRLSPPPIHAVPPRMVDLSSARLEISDAPVCIRAETLDHRVEIACLEAEPEVDASSH